MPILQKSCLTGRLFHLSDARLVGLFVAYTQMAAHTTITNISHVLPEAHGTNIINVAVAMINNQ